MVNKFCKFAMFMLCVNSLCGCGSTIKNKSDYITEIEDDSSYSEYILPMDYDLEKAKSDGCVIYYNDGKIDNEENIEKFYNDSINNKDSYLHILRFTMEGDAVISTYIYKDGEYSFCLDNRRDEMAVSKEVEFKKIKRIELSSDEFNRTVIIQTY